MSVTSLLEVLETAKIELWLEGDSLRFRAPRGALTEELRAEVGAHRAALIDELRARSMGGEKIYREPDAAYEPFPLTDIQAAYAVGRSRIYEHGGVGCHGYAEFAIDPSCLGHEPEKALTAAWAQVLECHPMLRAVIHAEGWQKIDPQMDVPLRVRGVEEGADVRGVLRDKVYSVQTEDVAAQTAQPMVDVVVTLDNESREAVLHFSVDLLITDFAGISVILSDFAKALRGEVIESPSLTFRDYLLTTRKNRQGPEQVREHARAQAFWREKAATLPEPFELSAAVGHPGEPTLPATSVRFTRWSHRLNDRQRSRLEQLSQSAGLTVTSVFVAALARVLHRYGAGERGLLAMTLLDREPLTADIGRVVGDFTSTTFVAADGRSGHSLVDLARETQASIFESLENKAVAGSELAAMGGTGAAGGRLRAPIVVTSTLGVDGEKSLGETLKPRSEYGISQTPQVLLDVQLSSSPEGGINIDWDSRDGAFASCLLEAAFADFRGVVENVCVDGFSGGDPLSLRPLPVLSRRDLFGGSDISATLHGPVLKRFLENPAAPALERPNGTVSRGQLVTAAALIRDWVLASEPHPQRVAISVNQVAEAIAVQLGVLMAGRSYVPLDPQWPQGRVAAVMQTLNSQGSALLLDDDAEILTQVRQALGGPVSEPHPTEFFERLEPDAEAYVIFTSGSTGTPKGVQVSHRQARTTLADLEERLTLGDSDAVLAVSRSSFDLSIFNVFGLLGVGGRVVLPSEEASSDPVAWLTTVQSHGVSIWNSVPAQLQLVLDELNHAAAPRAERPLETLRIVMVSGDWVPVEQPRELWNVAPSARFFSLGGATEAAIWSVLYEVEVAPEANSRSIPYGRALDNQGILVVNDDGEPAATFQEGDILITGDGVALGYLGDLPATEAAFYQDAETGQRCYRTGDRGRMLADGTIEFLGRRDGQVKIAGHRIELGEIESALESCPGVARAAAAVSDGGDGSAGKQLVAAVVPERSSAQAQEHLSAGTLCVEHIDATDKQFVDNIDGSAVRELADLVETSAMEHMAEVLARFPHARVQEIVDGLQAHGHAALLGRWIDFLAERDWLRRKDARIEVLHRLDPQRDHARWERIAQLDAQAGYGSQQLSYVRSCLDNLPGLLAGSVDPLALLFPGGSQDTAIAAYGENLFARWINSAAAAGIAQRARASKAAGQPLRILEVGGGVGGTTTPVLHALSDVYGSDLSGVEYLFTDISHYFFEDILRQWPTLETTLFDLNVAPWEQGIPSGTFDVVLCANVLHNSRNIEQALSRLSGLLVPGGSLVVLDSTSANAPLMTSMEFKEGLSGFTDVRQESGRPFLSLEQWLAAWKASPFAVQGQWPREDGHVMSVGSQHLFWATNTPEFASLDIPGLRAQVANVLPRAMVPHTLTVMPVLPLTTNGKIDRKVIAQRAIVERAHGRCEAAAEPLTVEQERVAGIWRSILELRADEQLAPDTDFFDCGGDSLLLARCVGRLRQEIPGASSIPWDDVMRRMMVNPTLAGCASAVNTSAASAETQEPTSAGSLVELLPATGLEDDVLVLIHDGSGGLGPYQDLLAALERLSARPRVMGLRRLPGDSYLKTDPNLLLDELAQQYASEVQEIQSARIHLFGYCMGGLIAAALATQLAEGGEPVASCTVVSSYRIPFTVEDDLLLDYSLAKLLHADPADAGIEVDDASLGRALNRARERSPHIIRAGALAEVAEPELAASLAAAPPTTEQRLERLAASGAQADWTAEMLADLRTVFRHSLSAVATWDAPMYLGNIRFLRQRGDLHFLPTLQEDMTDFWQEFCLGDLDVEDVDGTHFDCLTGDRADAVLSLVAQGWGA